MRWYKERRGFVHRRTWGADGSISWPCERLVGSLWGTFTICDVFHLMAFTLWDITHCDPSLASFWDQLFFSGKQNLWSMSCYVCIFIVTNEISVNIPCDDLLCYLVSDAVLGQLTFFFGQRLMASGEANIVFYLWRKRLDEFRSKMSKLMKGGSFQGKIWGKLFLRKWVRHVRDAWEWTIGAFQSQVHFQ